MIDEPNFPKDGPTYSAVKSFRIEWEANGEESTLEDEARYFRIEGAPATVRAEFSVAVPETGFSWKSDPIEAQTTSTVYGFFGGEVNGQYYMDGESPGGSTPEAPLPSGEGVSEGGASGAATSTTAGDLPDTGGPGLGWLFGR